MKINKRENETIEKINEMKMGEHQESWKTSSHADKIKKMKDNLENIKKKE